MKYSSIVFIGVFKGAYGTATPMIILYNIVGSI